MFGISIYNEKEYKTMESKTPKYYQDPVMNFAKNIIDYANEKGQYTPLDLNKRHKSQIFKRNN